jgi:hypothetical protein
MTVGVVGLAACGSNPTPIPVFVTPTPQPSTPAPLQAEVPDNGGFPTDTITSSQSQITPQPTPEILPGVTYGPIIGPNYTPESLATPLPADLHVRACPAIITAPQVTLYASPDPNAETVGTATERMKLDVSELLTDSAGNRWANTSGGWLMLTDQAVLDSMRACEILLGNLPDTTLFGLHVINGTRDEEVLALVRRLQEAGHPMGTLKGLNGAEALLNEVKAISPETITVFRSLHSPRGVVDCPAEPGQYGDPVSTAQWWMDGMQGYWDAVQADYFEIMNECPATLEWIAQFSVEAMRIANEQGRCLLIFSFPGGTPDINQFDALLPAYQYAVEHPCASGRQHGISIHAYGLEDFELASESKVWVTFRHRIFYERLLKVLPEAADLPVYITELGIGGGTIFPGCDLVIRDAIQYTYQLEEDPYVEGFHLWSVGTGAQWYDIAPCFNDLAAALITYYTPR